MKRYWHYVNINAHYQLRRKQLASRQSGRAQTTMETTLWLQAVRLLQQKQQMELKMTKYHIATTSCSFIVTYVISCGAIYTIPYVDVRLLHKFDKLQTYIKERDRERERVYLPYQCNDIQ